MNLAAWIRETYGFDAWWICFQFDRAVLTLGLHVDAMLAERDVFWERGIERSRPRYETATDALDALDKKPSGAMGLIALARSIGAVKESRT